MLTRAQKDLDSLLCCSLSIQRKNWRKDPDTYKSSESGVVNGTETLDWFPLGHRVWFVLCFVKIGHWYF